VLQWGEFYYLIVTFLLLPVGTNLFTKQQYIHKYITYIDYLKCDHTGLYWYEKHTVYNRIWYGMSVCTCTCNTETSLFSTEHVSGFVRILKNLENPWISEVRFQGLESTWNWFWSWKVLDFLLRMIAKYYYYKVLKLIKASEIKFSSKQSITSLKCSQNA